MQSQLRALFFDFDGVIVDSVHTKTEAFRTLFQGYSEEIIAKVLEYHRLHGGISRVHKISHAHEYFIGTPLGEDELEQWAKRYSELVVEKVIAEKWITGAREFLEKASRTELKIFVISGTPEVELRYIIKEKGLEHIFHEQHGSPVRKPDHIRNLLQSYKLKPAECVFIGDAYTDYDAAKETGLYFIGVQGDVEFPQGTMVLENCMSLQTALDSLFPEN